MPKANLPAKPRNLLWVWLGVIALVAVAIVGYLWLKPAPTAQPASAVAPTVQPDAAPGPLASTLPAAPTVQAAPPPVPIVKKHIYEENGDPKADVAAALVKAKQEHKRVILDFGGDWCGDCQVLDVYFHQSPNAELLAKNFILVHVWVGHIDTNLNIPEKYGVAVKKGVPALAVLAPNGTVVFAQKLGEFENMRSMESSSVTEFLNQWKS